MWQMLCYWIWSDLISECLALIWESSLVQHGHRSFNNSIHVNVTRWDRRKQAGGVYKDFCQRKYGHSEQSDMLRLDLLVFSGCDRKWWHHSWTMSIRVIRCPSWLTLLLVTQQCRVAGTCTGGFCSSQVYVWPYALISFAKWKMCRT